ncbi:MAG: glycosyltransferase, partial [Chloroflexi bacterium]|nr:glycosyltransferase [Chloroflexota bacterium]
PAHPRSDLVSLLQAHFPESFFGRRAHTELGLAYSQARLAFNRSLAGDLNMRVFEALCSGTMLLTDEADGLIDLFEDGKHLVIYRSPADLLEKAYYYVEHEEEREAIAAAGRAEALAKHTYRRRMERVLERVAHHADTVTLRQHGERQKEKEKSAGEKSRTVIRVEEKLAEAVDAGPVGPRVIRTEATRRYAPGQYFGWERPDVLARVPVTAKRVLDVGCAGGRLGQTIKERAAAEGLPEPEVVGIEVDPTAGAIASERLDRVIVGDVEELIAAGGPLAPVTKVTTERRRGKTKREEPSSGLGPFDCIIMADSLEHLRDPETAMRGLREWLTPDGCLVLSVPNVRHREVIQSLARGRWTYVDAGLLDRTHLRFFTRRDLEQALFRSGFQVSAISPILTPEHRGWVDAGRPGNLQFGPLGLTDLSPGDAEEFFAYQWIVTARPRAARKHALTSIVILARNQV